MTIQRSDRTVTSTCEALTVQRTRTCQRVEYTLTETSEVSSSHGSVINVSARGLRTIFPKATTSPICLPHVRLTGTGRS